MNHSDSERIAGILEMAGYQKTLSEDNADLIVINACSVRQSAINKISGRFKKYKKLRKINPDLKIILTGCVLKSDKKKFEKMFDLVIGIEEIGSKIKSPQPPFDKVGNIIIPSLIKKYNAVPPLLKGARGIYSDYFQIEPLRQNKFSAYIPIMTGCNNFCSYCVVPYTRGREYSRPAEEIISEVDNLVKQGYKEIILLGQNVNSYKSGVIDFPKLLKLINAIPGNFWIRFLTSHPKDMSEKLIGTVAESEKVTPYIHLALQSGNDEILKKMNRKYTAKHFLELVEMTRKYLPDAVISTDIIIGFPGETEKQFQDTVEIMKKAKFDMAYLNKYSPRAGTAAAKLDDNISWAEKKRRERILTNILKETALENNEIYIGKIIEVLVDESGIKNQKLGIISGKTKSFKNVKIPDSKFSIPDSDIIGKFLKIKIIQANAWGLEGEIIK